MNDRNANNIHLPRIPASETLFLEVDETRMWIYTTEEGSDPRYVEMVNLPHDEARTIGDDHLLWAEDACDRGGFLVTGYRKITSRCFELTAPKLLVDRLMLIRFDDGYQLHDLSQSPVMRLDLGYQAGPLLEEVEAVMVAATVADSAGYQPAGYRVVDDEHWKIMEYPRSEMIDKFSSDVADLSDPRRSDAFRVLVALLASVGFVVSIAMSTWADLSWLVSLVWFVAWLVIAWPVLPRSGRSRGRGRRGLYVWTCPVCYDDGVRASYQVTSQTEEMVQEIHDKAFHRGVS